MIEGPDFKNNIEAARWSLFEALNGLRENDLSRDEILGRLKDVAIYLKHQASKKDHLRHIPNPDALFTDAHPWRENNPHPGCPCAHCEATFPKIK